MKKQILVTGLSGISEAVRFVESSIPADRQQTGAQICPLVCEELLLRLLSMGCEEIMVTYKGILFPYIEISAKGNRADALQRSPEAADDGIGARINECLLEQYADHFTWQYRNEVNLYRVFTEPGKIMDLTDEISGFYKNADPEKEHKPTDVLLYITRRHRGFFFFSVFIHLLKHLAALMLPVFVANIINTVTATGAFFVPPVMVNILLSAVALIVNLVCYWIDSRFYRRFTRAVEAGFRMALVQKLQTLSIRFHRDMQTGVVLSKLVSDVQYIQMLIYDRFMEVLYLCEDLLFITVVALINFPLMLVFYAVIIPVVVYMAKKFSGPLQDRRAGMRQQNEQVSAAVKEMLEMAGLTRAHGLEKTEYRIILTRVRKAQGASVLYDRQTVSVNNITYGGFQALRLLSLSFAALLTVAGRIGVGTLVLFQSIFEMIISNVQRMLDAVPLITQGYDSLKSVNEILYADDIEQNGSALLPSPVRGKIEFRHVSFSYAPDQEPVLKDVSFRVPAGGSIAFVGKSGEGKSTTLNLILGLYAAQKGEILIDGININTLDKPAYRRHIAVVPQQTVLFSGTLWDNLVYGLHYVSTDKMMDVIRRVGLEDLVASLPEGLNTRISESGGNLSGGQRQRVAIARALLRSPKIILLDEATSALDAESERQVQEAVDAIMGSCTVVMVAHRLHTLCRADVICRIRNGRLERCEDIGRSLQDAEGGDLT